MDVSTIGLDLANNVFQVHCVDRGGKVVIRKKVRRNKLLNFFAGIPSCVVGMEAFCSAHHEICAWIGFAFALSF